MYTLDACIVWLAEVAIMNWPSTINPLSYYTDINPNYSLNIHKATVYIVGLRIVHTLTDEPANHQTPFGGWSTTPISSTRFTNPNKYA
jgi:hypothetical protein